MWGENIFNGNERGKKGGKFEVEFVNRCRIMVLKRITASFAIKTNAKERNL